jgi:hypothetical protein
MAGAHNLSRAHNNIGVVVPDYQASGFLLNRTELLDPEAEDVAIEKFTLLQIGNRDGEGKAHRTDISMSILMLSQKDRNCLAKAYGAHGKGVCRHGRRQSNGHGRRKVSLGMGATRPY